MGAVPRSLSYTPNSEFTDHQKANVALFNLCLDARAQGAVGHMGVLMRQIGLCRLLKYDKEKRTWCGTQLPVFA